MEPLLTTTEAAKRLGLAVRTLENWRQLGKGPAYCRLSRRIIRYRPEDLEAWVAKEQRKGAGEAADTES